MGEKKTMKDEAKYTKKDVEKHEAYIRSLEKSFRQDLNEIVAIHKQLLREDEERRKKAEIEHKKAEAERKKAEVEDQARHKKTEAERKKAEAEYHKKIEADRKEEKERRAKWDKGMEELRASHRETEAQIKETSKELNKFIGQSGHRWGKLGENLVKGSLVQKLKERGIKKINRVVENARKGDLEYDIIAVNGTEVVIVEVKATLEPCDVRDFIKSISKFKTHWPEYKDMVIYGSIAYLLKANREAEKLAEREGFFVVEAVGDVIIKNKQSFKPKVFG